MKHKISKDLKKGINKVFFNISKNKFYKALVKKHYFLRIFLGIFFICFGIFAFIMPLVPFSFIFFMLGFSMLFDIKIVKGKFLYFLNKSGLKNIFIKIYMKYFFKYKNKKIKKD